MEQNCVLLWEERRGHQQSSPSGNRRPVWFMLIVPQASRAWRPCGTAWMTKILHRIREGHGTPRDLELLVEVANSMGIIPGTTICGLADGAAWPVKNAIQKFRGEFEDYIQNKKTSVDPIRELVGAH